LETSEIFNGVPYAHQSGLRRCIRYGKTEQLTEYKDGEARQRCRHKPRKQWLVLIPNTHDGYVSWEQFEQVQLAIGNNMRGWQQSGALQNGAALLGGVLRCRRCGRKLMVQYTGERGDIVRYSCNRGRLDNGQPRCIGFGGTTVDEAIGHHVLRVVQPAAVEAAIMASKEEGHRNNEVLDALKRDLEAARYAAQRAQKQYDHADPRIARSPLNWRDAGMWPSNECEGWRHESVSAPMSKESRLPTKSFWS
jgi:hypothetical protein